MKPEEKKLLLKDLCARLPYGVKIKLGDYDYQVCGYNTEKEMPVKIWFYYDSNQTLKSYVDVYLTDYRPYLRSMSNMTEEEKIDYGAFFNYDGVEYPDEYIDWLNERHFDYRGLIEKGLAIAVTEENNPYKN